MRWVQKLPQSMLGSLVHWARHRSSAATVAVSEGWGLVDHAPAGALADMSEQWTKFPCRPTARRDTSLKLGSMLLVHQPASIQAA